MADEYFISRFSGAAELLPHRFRTYAVEMPDEIKLVAEEFRLRFGRPPTVLTPGGELPLSIDTEETVTSGDLAAIMDLATRRFGSHAKGKHQIRVRYRRRRIPNRILRFMRR